MTTLVTTDGQGHFAIYLANLDANRVSVGLELRNASVGSDGAYYEFRGNELSSRTFAEDFFWQEGTIEISNAFEVELVPYSARVIRFSTE